MQHSFARLAVIVLLGGTLAACGSSPKKEGDGKSAPPNQLPSGQTSPADANAGAGGSAFGNGGVTLPAEKTVYFEYDKSDIRSQDRALLEAHAAYLKANPDVVARLEGHADERGSREYNLALGERRAMAVSRFISILGVGEQQMQTASYGEEKPAAGGHDESSWQQNRRVDFVYSGGR